MRPISEEVACRSTVTLNADEINGRILNIRIKREAIQFRAVIEKAIKASFTERKLTRVFVKRPTGIYWIYCDRIVLRDIANVRNLCRTHVTEY